MTLRKAFVAIPVGAVIAAASIAPVATSARTVHKHATHHRRHRARVRSSALSGSNVNCNGIAPASVTYDLTVPSGKTCTINHSSVGHDVNVQSGATLIDNGGSIGHDINGNYPKGIGIGAYAGNPGSVGNDITIIGASGAGPGTAGNNYICATQIGLDLSVTYSTSKAGQWIIGDRDEQCSSGGNLVAGNAIVQNNLTRVDVADNMSGAPPYQGGISKNLTVTGNLVSATAPVVESNFVGNNATCQSGTKKDSDGTPNVVGGMNNGCH